MDKDWKLQRYSRKDYTDLVDFPVEIVGRDGVVRRYSFEDAIRLYQRRITFASVRYRDLDLVNAEVGHCRSRIDQLRRSYFHRFGWGTAEGKPEPLEVFGDVAGELAAFICRVLRCVDRPDVVVEPIAGVGEKISSWYLVPGAGEHGLLLYVYRFEGSDAELTRDAFFTALKRHEQTARSGGDDEKLLAFHHTVDCGFVLTARAEAYEAFAALREEEEPPDLVPTPWDEALEVARRGDFEEAVARCRQIVTDQPWHRSAYVGGAVLATALRKYYDAEDFALVGTCYFPDDGVLHYHAAVARHRLGRIEEAIASLHKAIARSPDLSAARFLLFRLLFDEGRMAEARAVLAEGRSVRPDVRRSENALARVEQWMRWRSIVHLLAGISFVLGVLALGMGSAIGILPILMSVLTLIGASLLFKRQLDQLTARQRFNELSQGLQRIHRKLDPDAPLVS